MVFLLNQTKPTAGIRPQESAIHVPMAQNTYHLKKKNKIIGLKIFKDPVYLNLCWTLNFQKYRR